MENNNNISKTLFCKKGHKLIWSPISQYHLDYICNSCSKQCWKNEGAFVCRTCQFDICQNCYNVLKIYNTNEKNLKCPMNHILSNKSTGILEAFFVRKCDQCSQKLNMTNYEFFSCISCDYDICHLCYCLSDLDTSNSLNVSCVSGHKLKWCESTKYPQGIFVCDSCKKTSLNKECVAHCQQCFYDLCKTCFYLKQKNMRVLNKIKTLEIKENGEDYVDKMDNLSLLDKTLDCNICFDAQKDTCFEPCYHLCCCNECATIIFSRNKQCPYCRQNISGLRRIYIV